MDIENMATSTDWDLVAGTITFNTWLFMTIMVLVLVTYFSKKFIDQF